LVGDDRLPSLMTFDKVWEAQVPNRNKFNSGRIVGQPIYQV